MTFLRFMKKRAFTLVELLVVIAIIGILAAIVMPAISSALLRGKALSLSANGRSMHQMLVQKQTEDIYTTVATFWPIKGNTDPDQGLFDTSTDYFRYMVTNGNMNVAFSFFAAPGVPAANGATDFEGKNNAWLVVSDGEDLPETAPLFMSRNIGGDDYTGFDTLESSKIPEENGLFNGGGDPFGNKAFIFTTRGGASYSLIKDDLKISAFTNIFMLNDKDGNELGNDILLVE